MLTSRTTRWKRLNVVPIGTIRRRSASSRTPSISRIVSLMELRRLSSPLNVAASPAPAPAISNSPTVSIRRSRRLASTRMVDVHWVCGPRPAGRDEIRRNGHGRPPSATWPPWPSRSCHWPRRWSSRPCRRGPCRARPPLRTSFASSGATLITATSTSWPRDSPAVVTCYARSLIDSRREDLRAASFRLWHACPAQANSGRMACPEGVRQRISCACPERWYRLRRNCLIAPYALGAVAERANGRGGS